MASGVARRLPVLLALAMLAADLDAARQTTTAPRDRPPQESVAPGTITGRVVDPNSGAPVRRAIVSAYSSVLGDTRQRAAQTDAAGRFTITDLPTGRYDIGIYKPGYFPPDTLQHARGARPPRVDVVPGSRSTLTLSLVRGGAITGRVTDDTGEPLMHVRVQALSVSGRMQGPAAQEQTDDLGQYRLFGLLPGDYLVQAVPDGWNSGDFTVAGESGVVTTYYPGTPARADAQRVRVRAGSDVTGIHIALASARLARISGTVTDSLGRPVTAGVVMVGEEGDGFGSTRSGGPIGESGRFSVESLPPGTYTLSVMTGAQDDPETESTSVPVTLASENLEGLALVTSPPAIVSGRVVFDPTPEDPAVRANRFPLTLDRRHDRGAASVPFGGGVTRPAEDGTFELRMHGEGRADPQPADQWPAGWILDSVLVGGVDVSATGIEFHVGEAVRDVQIVLTKHGATLEGTVTNARGAAAPHAIVVVLPDQVDSPSRFGAFTTEADDHGRFSLTPMRSGAYVVAAVKEAEGFDQQTLEKLRPSAVPFHIARGEKKVLNLRLVER